MNEDFVTYELAKKLKEKGYPQHIADFAYIVDNYGEDECNIGDRLPISLVPDYMDDVSAPTISQVLKWLREEKKIVISILPTLYNKKTGLPNYYYIIHDVTEYSWRIEEYPQSFESWEECALGAIEYALDNLI